MPGANLADDLAAIVKASEAVRDRIRNDLVEPAGAIEETREFLFDEDRQMRFGKRAANGAHRRQTHYHVAEPVDGLDENSLRSGRDS